MTFSVKTEYFNLSWNSVCFKSEYWQKQIQVQSGEKVPSQSSANSDRVPRIRAHKPKLQCTKDLGGKAKMRKERRSKREKVLVKIFLKIMV